jgi:multicomponent K+:H+ antiporter subunit G
MIETELSAWVVLPVSLLLVLGGLVTLIGSLGLLRLPDFFARVHGPSMGNTVGTGSVLIASMLTSSALAGRPVVHELLITLFIVMSSPVTSMMLVRAALYRNKVREEKQQAAKAHVGSLSQ